MAVQCAHGDERRHRVTTSVSTHKVEPALKLNFLSHGTLESKDIDASRRFYEEFLGLEVVRTSEISLLVRLGGNNVLAVVKVKNKQPMSIMGHNGLDVATREDVDQAYRIVLEQKDKWGLHDITTPKLQHGTYSFYFWDADDNCWEILSNPPGGYSWLFEVGDQRGKGHHDRNFPRPGVTRA
jgi:catechol 2,3-dioxygenase-like lactoylglutathione lyase family enzyme